MTAPDPAAAELAIAKLATPHGTAEELVSQMNITGKVLRLLQAAGPHRLEELTDLVVEALRR